MRAKLIVAGREFPIEIQDPELQKLLKPQKKTGYERVEELNFYYYVDSENNVATAREHNQYADDVLYEAANYYLDRTVAENNARADKLMRQLRRFAVEHRKTDLNFCDEEQTLYYICYYDFGEDCTLDFDCECQYPRQHGVIYFDSVDAVKLAIETFHDELIWYFTEYKDSL